MEHVFSYFRCVQIPTDLRVCIAAIYTQASTLDSIYFHLALCSTQDVVGEVETFNYPRFLMEGFQFLGSNEGSLSAVEGDGCMGEVMGDAVRMCTMQARYAMQ